MDKGGGERREAKRDGADGVTIRGDLWGRAALPVTLEDVLAGEAGR